MRITFLVFWYAILFSIFAASSKSAEAPPLIPKQFSAAIGGFLGGSYRVELLNGSLTYTAFDDGKPQPLKITPTAAQWREFRQTLDTLKIWQWRDTYYSGD